jgi:hypothetical protein
MCGRPDQGPPHKRYRSRIQLPRRPPTPDAIQTNALTPAAAAHCWNPLLSVVSRSRHRACVTPSTMRRLAGYVIEARIVSPVDQPRVVAHRRETTARDAPAPRHAYPLVLRDLFCNAPQRRLAG